MTVQEYADKQGVSPRTVYRWIEEGQVNAKKVGNMWQVISEDGDCKFRFKIPHLFTTKTRRHEV